MIIYYLIVFIYLTFLLDFIVWPIKSEASTRSLITKPKTSFVTSLLLLLVFAINLLFYLTPLLLSYKAILLNTPIVNLRFSIFGIILAIIGRGITIAGALVLRKSEPDQLITNSIFKFSRNPISLGMHMTILGMIVIFPTWYLWLGLVIYLLNLHFKIKAEERFLKIKFKDEYFYYQKLVPRYLIA